MKSSIDRAGEPTQLRVPGNREFCAGRARRRGREALWARQVFTLISTALALRERLALPHREGLCQWAVARFINTPHTPHPQRGAQAPARGGEEFGGICSHPARACCPPCHGPSLCYASPKSLSCGRKVSRAWQRSSSLTREPALGKTRLLPWKHFSFSGSTWVTNRRQGRTGSRLPGWAKGLPAPRSPAVQA